MGYGPQNRFWRPLQKIRKAHQKCSVSQPDRIVDVGKGEELDLQLGYGRIRTQFTVSFLEDFEQPFAHGEARLA